MKITIEARATAKPKSKYEDAEEIARASITVEGDDLGDEELIEQLASVVADQLAAGIQASRAEVPFDLEAPADATL